MTFQSPTSSARRPVCVVGLGLIGGSFLRAMVAAGVPVFGTDASAANCAAARASGFEVIDDAAVALRRAEDSEALVCVAVPMGAVDSVLSLIAREAPSVGVFDVVSVKEPVLTLARTRGLGSRYVGTHPMAGTASSGWDAGRSRLFTGATWVICFDQTVGPTTGQNRSAAATEGESHDAGCGLDPAGRRQNESAPSTPHATWVSLWVEVARLITLTGARLVPARARVHDEAVARVSHLPHVFAETLSVCGSSGGPLSRALAAGSFRDGTRVAGTRPELVRAMCESNASAILPALDQAIALLHDAREGLTSRSGAGKEPNMAALAEAGFDSHARLSSHRSGRDTDTTQSSDNAKRRHEGPAGQGVVVAPGEPGWVNDLLRAEAAGLPVTLAGVATPPCGQ